MPTVPPAPSTPPAPTPISIAEARDLPLGQQATIRGVLTTPLGLLEDGRVAFVQDASAGIAVYVDPASAVVVPPGAVLVATGTLDERYGARTLRVSLPAVVIEGPGSMPTPEPVLTGSVGESVEGRRITVTGTTSGAPTDFADGLGILVDDGSGPVRAIVSPDALDSRSVPAGSVVTVVGPVGQRDSSGTGAGGYRIHATSDGDLVVQPPASPSPSPNPSSSPSPSAAPSLPAPTASPTPSPGSMPRPIGEARGLPIGATVTVAGVVTAEAGRLGTPRLIAIEDATGGLVVKLAEGLAAPGRGSWIEVEGVLADPFGQLELRVGSTGLRVRGNAALPLPAPVTAAQIGEGTEARLVVVSGSVPKAPTKSAANDIAFDLVDGAGDRIRITADASSGLSTAAVRAGRSYRITGIAAQRASRKGALDGYRVWLRDGLDLVAVAAPPAGVGISTGAEAPALPIAEAVQLEDGDVTVEGSVTASASLLDTTGRRIVLQDGTGAVEVLLPSGAAQPGPGSRLRVEGTMGRAYGAPRLRASAITKLTGDSRVEPRVLVGDPGASVEWQLVKLSGTVGKVTRLGARWRAELERDGRAYLIDGLPGSSIPSTALVEGRAVSVVGVVRRPYPAATDRRFAIVPRSPADVQVRIGGSGAGDEASAGAPEGTTGQQAVGLQTDAADVDLGALAEHAGEVVRVGGLVVEPTADGFSLDDGTAIGVVVLDGDAAAYRGLIEAGDAVNAVGVVQAGPPGEWFVRVTEPGALLRVGDLGQPQAIGLAAPTEAPEPPPDEELVNPPETTSRRLGFDQLIVDIGGGTGLASLGLMTALSVAVAAFRRRRARACAARLAARLERYAGVNVNPGP